MKRTTFFFDIQFFLLGLFQARVGKVTSFHIETLGRSAREFDVVVSGPTGSAVPVRCYQTKTGKLQAEFTSREIGSHKVEVLLQGKHVNGSPFTCQSFDPDNVRIVDIPTSQGNVGEKVYFNGKYFFKNTTSIDHSD